MSKYNQYAKKLSEAFEKASESMREAYAAFQEAEEARERGVDNSKPERYPGEYRVEKNRLDAAYTEAQATLKKTQRAAWNEFYKTRDRIGRDLEAEVNKSYTANPDDLDDKTLQLLNSGILNADDYQELYNRNENNATMRRMIGSAAEKAAGKLENSTAPADVEARRTLTAISYDSKQQARPAVLQEWDNLCNVSEHYSGQSDGGADPAFVCKMNGHWADDDVQTAINDF